MLSYWLNGEPLALSEDAKIRLTWNNPFCNFDEIEGDLAIGIEIPFNDHNKMKLLNPERYERHGSSDIRVFSGFEIRYGAGRGSFFMGGDLKIYDASTEKYMAWLQGSVGRLGDTHREKHIFDSESFDKDQVFQNKANYDSLGDDYACPKIFNQYFFANKGRKETYTRMVYNLNFTGSHAEDDEYKKVDYENEIMSEAFMRTAAAFVNTENEDGTVRMEDSEADSRTLDETMNVYVVSPMLFLSKVFDLIFTDVKYSIDRNFIKEDPELRKLLVYNNFDITGMGFSEKDEDHTVGSWSNIIWEHPYENTPMGGGEFSEWQEKQVVVTVETVRRFYNDTFKYKDLLPRVKLADWILSTQNLLNVCFFFKRNNKVDVLDREAILNGTAIDIEKYFIGDWVMGEKLDVTLKFMFSHDSDDLYFAERWTDIDAQRENEVEPVETLNDLPAFEDSKIGDVCYIRKTNTYMRFDWAMRVIVDPNTGEDIEDDAIGWNYLSVGYQNGYFKRGNNEAVIATEFSTLFGDQTTFTQQPGNLKGMKYAFETFSPRLLFYEGENRAKSENETIALDWEKKDKGLMKKRWSATSRFWSTRQAVSRSAAMPFGVLMSMVDNLPYKFRSREGEFIVKTLSVDVGMHGIEPVKIDAFKY